VIDLKVLVTGGCGFLGSHVCEYYRTRGSQVVSIDNMTTHELKRTGYPTDLAREYNYNFLLEHGVSTIKADIRDFKAVVKSAKGCDFLVHTAAQPAMTIGIDRPRLDLSTNVLGTFNILDAARRLDIPAVICSTIHVYGNRINDALTEGLTRYERSPASIDELATAVEGTLTPLHASKRSAELYAQVFADSYGLRVGTFRLSGLYGSRQFGGEDHGWVANFAIRLLTGKPITIYGTGKQVRDILHASDAAAAFDAFYGSRAKGIYNIGGGSERSISLLECLRLLKEIMHRDAIIHHEPERLGDLRYFVCDIAKAKREMGWQPSLTIEQGLEELASWVESHEREFSTRETISASL
jgi:CDP-paratose 2-epimerase